MPAAIPTSPAPTRELPPSMIQDETNLKLEPDNHTPAINQVPDPARVTPLHNLANEGDVIDCPFCQRRTAVRVTKVGTSMQTVVGAVLCLFCICLTCVPCLAGWFENVEYYCRNCNRKVAVRPHDGPLQTFGPQTHDRTEPSQYPPPAVPPK